MEKQKCKECGEPIFNRQKSAIYCKECSRERNRKASGLAGKKKELIINILKKKYNVYSLDDVIDKLRKL